MLYLLGDINANGATVFMCWLLNTDTSEGVVIILIMLIWYKMVFPKLPNICWHCHPVICLWCTTIVWFEFHSKYNIHARLGVPYEYPMYLCELHWPSSVGVEQIVPFGVVRLPSNVSSLMSTLSAAACTNTPSLLLYGVTTTNKLD